MPQYFKLPENWGERGKFIITPSPFLRRIWPIKSLLPYHVGDRVRFSIHFENPNKNEFMPQFIWEKIGDRIKPIVDIKNTDVEIIGSIIDCEGDVGYNVGFIFDKNDLHPIFTAKVESWDTIFYKWVWAIIGAIFSLLCGLILWLLNFIQINSHWKLIP